METFEESLQRQYNELNAETIRELLTKVKNYLYLESMDNLHTEESFLVASISKVVIKSNRLTFKQWKSLNWFVVKKLRSATPVKTF
jgi:hypothetical protein